MARNEMIAWSDLEGLATAAATRAAHEVASRMPRTPTASAVARELVGGTASDKPIPFASFLGMSDKDLREYSIVRAALDLVRRRQDRVSFAANARERAQELYEQHQRRPQSLEEECSRAVEKQLGIENAFGRFFVPLDIQCRDLTASGVSGSNYLVGTSQPSFVAAKRAASVVARLGATHVGPLVDNATFPKRGTNTAYWLSDENTQITESQQTVGQLAMTPRTVAAICDISHQLSKQIGPAGEAMLLADLGADIAVAVDAAALAGSGAAGQPIGILSTPNVGTFTGTSLGAAGILDAQQDVAAANAVVSEASCGFVTTPTVAGLLKGRPQLLDGTAPIWTGPVHAGRIDEMPAYSTTSMTAATMVYGDFSQLVIAEWGLLELLADPFTNFTTGGTKLRALWHVDIAARYAAAFSIATSIT
jgi:HK97 family phage major capsid protein